MLSPLSGHPPSPLPRPLTHSTISVIIPASRPAALARCLESLARCRGPGPAEIILVLNDASARHPGSGCARVAAGFAQRLPGLKLLEGGPFLPGAARNLALESARGDWLCFLDDDVTVPPLYFGVLAEKLRSHPQASVLGGPNLTPPGSPLFARCVGHLLGSWLGAGSLATRCSGYPADSWTDDRGLILCNLCVRRQALASEGLRFDEDLLRNEENLLLARLFARGHRALHSPELYVHHERRAGLASFCRQSLLSGRGRAGMTLKLPGSLRPLHLLPVLLGVCVLGGPFLPRSLGLAAAAYAAAALANALSLTLRRGEPARAALWLWLLHPAAHLSYAAGLLAGLAAGLPRR